MLRVILVDDQLIFREVIRIIVENYVDLVAEIDSFEKALPAAKKYRPNGAIIDVNIRGHDGFRLARKFLQFDPNMKIILTSSSFEHIYFEMTHNIPGATFVAKEKLTGELIQAIIGGRTIR